MDQIQQRKNDMLLETHIASENERYDLLIERLDKLEIQVESIVELLHQTKGVVNFVKWTAYIVSSLSAVYLFITSHVSIVPK